jgi:hypothetical protein
MNEAIISIGSYGLYGSFLLLRARNEGEEIQEELRK